METEQITTTQTEQIIKSISDINKLLEITKSEHEENIYFYNLLEETSEREAIKEFLKSFNIEEEAKQIKLYIDGINQLRSELNKSYSLNPTIKNHYVVIYKKDNNIYLFLDKRQNINRKTNIEHFFYILYKTHKISKYEFKIFREYKTLSYNMKSRLNTYLIHKINKTSHKKHYEYLGDSRHEKYNYYDEDTRQNYKIKFDISLLKLNSYSFITDEIRQKAYTETRIKETQCKTKLYL